MRTSPAIPILAGVVLLGFASHSFAADGKREPTAAEKISKAANHNACVFANSVYDWQSLDDNNMVIWSPGRRNAYLVTFTMPLFGARHATRLAFIDHNHDGRLCAFGMDAIGVGDSVMPEKSTISTMTRLDDDAIAQLEDQYKTRLVRDGKKKKPKEPTAASAL